MMFILFQKIYSIGGVSLKDYTSYLYATIITLDIYKHLCLK